jgi:hypothetical protein
MLRVITLTLLLFASTGGVSWAAEQSAPANEVQGVWRGPWYRGMTSGILTLQIDAAGGTATFSNLDNFGEAPAVLRALSFDGSALSFRAVGASPQELEASINLTSGGMKLRGFGKYEGFKLRMELEKQP